ncbi:MAG: response regulator [Archangium sp.]|nr:response regulator [Archangium sp.]
MKVLVADDSQTQRKLLTGLLKGMDVEAVEASSGAEALDHLLRADGPSIALIDWEMPNLSGVEVCRKVREATLEIRPHLLLVTGRSERADVVEALEAGADDFLTKPPHPAELQARVQVGMRNVQLQRELQVRINELKSTLRRLDVVGGLAAQSNQKVAGAARQGTLRPQLEALDAVRALPERFAAVLENLEAPEQAAPAAELWAHLALALPAQAAWLDVTLEVSRALATSAVKKLSNSVPTTDQALLDCVSDVMTLVLRGFQQQLETLGIEVLKPLSARGFVGSLAMPVSEHRLRLVHRGWTLQLIETPTEVSATRFAELSPGTMLVSSLTPPNMPGVEVLAKGTVLRPSYLTRAGSFFRGDAAATEVPVMSASGFALQHRA